MKKKEGAIVPLTHAYECSQLGQYQLLTLEGKRLGQYQPASNHICSFGSHLPHLTRACLTAPSVLTRICALGSCLT